MNRIILLTILTFLYIGTINGHTPAKNSWNDNIESLRISIVNIINGKDATVGVALIVDGKDTLTVNNHIQYPTLSVYKFHLALAVLDYMHLDAVPL